MRREYQTYKCRVCFFQTEDSYYATNSYGNFHDGVDLQAMNAERESGVLASNCPCCKKGRLENLTWLEDHDPSFVQMSNDDWWSLLKKDAARWNIWRSAHPFNNPCLDNRDFREMDLTGRNMAYASLQNTNLSGKDLRSIISFKEYCLNDSTPIMQLNGANCQGANLSDVYLSNVDLTGVNLSEADLSGSTMERVCLVNAILINADLRGATLSVTSCKGADFTGCKIHGAKIESFGRVMGSCYSTDSPEFRSLSSLEKVKRADYIMAGVNGDERVPETGKFSPVEFGMYIDPEEEGLAEAREALFNEGFRTLD